MVRIAKMVAPTESSLDDRAVWQKVTRIARAALRDAIAVDDAAPPRVRARLEGDGEAEDAYDVRAQPLLHAGGPAVVVVAVERVPARIPSADDVRDDFGLSPRQAQVAVLLARRLSTKEIAARLRISRHTARRHVEAVLVRLRVHSRAAVREVLVDTADERAASVRLSRDA